MFGGRMCWQFLGGLGVDGSPGPDGIYPSILWEAKNWIGIWNALE